MKIPRILLVILFISIMFIGCLDIIDVDQPATVPVDYTFNTIIHFQSFDDSDADGSTRFGAAMLPDEITINSAVYNGNIALVENAAYETQLTTDFPPDPCYHRWVGTSSDNDSKGFFDCVISMTSGSTIGNYLIDYRAGYNNGSMVYKDAELDVPIEIALLVDTDGDLIPDPWENLYSCMMANTVDNDLDYDSDSLINEDEYDYLTNPCEADSDDDGMDDGWEIDNSTYPLQNDSNSDPDSDDLTNLQEYNLGTDPQDPDSDSDGMEDGWENKYGCVDVFFPDNNQNPDNDAFDNLAEFNLNSDPCTFNVDTDSDGLMDEWENTYDCMMASTVDDQVDYDQDNMTNLMEFGNSTDPCNADTDQDGSDDDKDCEPTDEKIHPGAVEICDGKDNQCEGDEGYGFIDINCQCDPGIVEKDDLLINQAEMRVNAPDIATDSNDNLIVAWYYTNGLDSDIYARRFDGDGNPIEDEFRVDQGTSHTWFPQIGTDNNNNFIITWQDNSSGKWDILARRYDSSANPLGDSFIVDQSILDSWRPSIAVNSDNSFIITWHSEGIFARWYGPDGNAIGNEFRVDQGLAIANSPKITVDSNDNFIITWQDNRLGNYSIYARRFDSDANPLSDDFRVDQMTDPHEAERPDIATDNNNNFIVTWKDIDVGFNIYARRFNSDGSSIGDVFKVDQGKSLLARYPVIATDSNNGFIIIWDGFLDEDHNVFARDYNSDGSAKGDSHAVKQGISDEELPAISVNNNDYYYIAWKDKRSGDYSVYIKGQFFGWTDLDCDGVLDYLEDSSGCMSKISPDSDEDGLCDGPVSVYDGPSLICIGGEDMDGNGLFEDKETNACEFDTDFDGMDDLWEDTYTCLNPSKYDADKNSDSDKFSNLEEYNNNTDPCLPKKSSSSSGSGCMLINEDEKINIFSVMIAFLVPFFTIRFIKLRY